MDDKNNISNDKFSLAFIPLAVAINVGIGAIIKAFNLPLYLDSIGTIITTILLGWRKGMIVGILGFVIMAVFINPFTIYFIGTQACIAVFVNIIAQKGGYKNIYRVILSGIGLGIIAGLVSAPVIVIVFQGATGNGSAIITSFFASLGNQILNSIVLSGLSIEPLDKTIQTLLAIFLIKNIPTSFLQYFNIEVLKKNNLYNGV